MYIPVGLNGPPYNVYNFIYNVNRASLLNMKINFKKHKHLILLVAGIKVC